MNLLDDLPSGVRVGLDSAPVVYWIESHPVYYPILLPFFRDRVNAGINEAVASTLVLAEVLVKPLQLGRNDLATQYHDFFAKANHLSLESITPKVAGQAAEFRAQYGLRLPDACQIAAGLNGGVTHFITNDKGLRRVTELRVLILEDYIPLSP